MTFTIVGVDPGFDHSSPLDPGGNALGPFTIGQPVKVITKVINRTGTRTTAPKAIVIEVPI